MGKPMAEGGASCASNNFGDGGEEFLQRERFLKIGFYTELKQLIFERCVLASCHDDHRYFPYRGGLPHALKDHHAAACGQHQIKKNNVRQKFVSDLNGGDGN